jgi:DNA invertase Pin-like site-specific DNA recombinase
MTRRQAVAYSRDDASRQAIVAFCRERNLELAATIVDAKTAESAVEKACTLGGVLVAHNIAALAESMLDIVRLCRRLRASGADLVLIAEGVDTSDAAQGGAVMRMIEAMASLEYHRLADRLPYGYEVDDDLEHVRLNPERASVIRRIVQSHVEGRADDRIADELNREGVAARQGGRWDAAAVKKVVDHAPTSRWPVDDEVK